MGIEGASREPESGNAPPRASPCPAVWSLPCPVLQRRKLVEAKITTTCDLADVSSEFYILLEVQAIWGTSFNLCVDKSRRASAAPQAVGSCKVTRKKQACMPSSSEILRLHVFPRLSSLHGLRVARTTEIKIQMWRDKHTRW
jgi:hypothetical protein